MLNVLKSRYSILIKKEFSVPLSIMMLHEDLSSACLSYIILDS